MKNRLTSPSRGLTLGFTSLSRQAKCKGENVAIFQLARWRGPVPNKNVGAMVRPFKGLVLHIQQGNENGTDSWFHNPASQVSAHFGNPKTGGLDQWVDTNDKAWAQVAGNSAWISLENEGNSGDSLTATQVANAATLLAWLNITESVSLTLANSPTDSGLGYHAMGGAAWGGHTDCPGQPIIDQRAAICSAAQALVISPTVTGISPASGAAGTSVVITGSGFTFASSVGFGNTSATQMNVDSDTQITATAPTGSGTVDVVVTTIVGTSATGSADQFSYGNGSSSTGGSSSSNGSSSTDGSSSGNGSSGNGTSSDGTSSDSTDGTSSDSTDGTSSDSSDGTSGSN